jgi:DNA processing protein
MHQNIILHLSLIEGIGPSVIKALVDRVGIGRIPELYAFTVADFMMLGFGQKTAQTFVDGLQDQKKLENELDLMRTFNAGLVTFLCPEYPTLLKEIHVPPAVLYYQGDLSLFAHEKNIACVGSRKATRYVADALKCLIAPMVNDGWVIVSGGALGADTFAHQMALDMKSKTIVVVGSGLCHQYPPQNKKLFESVVQAGGLIVSSFAMNIFPDPRCFPIRNRLISGLSRGCLVLQAASKSGALITARCALEQGREVFALPGSIFDPLSAGCHALIADGAKLVTCSQDIVDELDYGHQLQQLSDQHVQQPLFVPAEKIDISNGALDDLSSQILQYATVAITADLLMSKLQIDLHSLQNKLFELSLDGRIAQDAMGFWKRL